MNNAELIERLRSYPASDDGVTLVDLRILHVAADALAAQEWQPMETAPKDGTKFDVWYPHHDATIPTPAHRVTDVYWSDVQEDFCTDGIYGPEEPSPLMAYSRPTAWRPLPPPPETTK